MRRGSGAIAGLLLVAALLAVRVVALDADPPSWLSWSAGIYTDEGFYAGDARQAAITGHWSPGDFHGAVISPPLYWLQLAAFHRFGPGLTAARSVSVLCGMVCIGLLFAALRRLYDNRVAWIGAILLGFSAPFVLYNRLALMETPAAMLITAAVLCLSWLSSSGEPAAFVERKGVWRRSQAEVGCARIPALLVGGALFGLALATKVLALPISVGLATWANAGNRGRAWIWIMLGMAATVACIVEFWTRRYAGHLSAMDHYYLVKQFAPHSLSGLMANFSRALWTGHRDGLLPTIFRLDPGLTVLGFLGLFAALRARTDGDLLLLGWLLPMCAVLACLSYTPTRYDVLFLPALAGLAARLFAHLRWPAFIRSLVIATVVVVALNARIYAHCALGMWHPAYTVSSAGHKLAGEFAPGSVLIGQSAPELCMSNRLTAVMVQPGLANDAHPVEKLNATAVLVTRSPYWDAWWTARYPALIVDANRIDTLQCGPRMVVDVYRVPPLVPGGRPSGE